MCSQLNLVERIKEAQKSDLKRAKLMNLIKDKQRLEFEVNGHGVIQFKSRLQVTSKKDRKKEVLKEVHYLSYTIHQKV